MAKYSRSEGRWTVSSTLVGWGVTAVAILLVGFFLVGMYIGYGMGVEEGKQVVREEIRSGDTKDDVSDQIASLVEDRNTQKNSNNPPEFDSTDQSNNVNSSGTSAEDGAFTESDLGISNDESGSKKSSVNTSPQDTQSSSQTTNSSQEETDSDRIPAIDSNRQQSTESSAQESNGQTTSYEDISTADTSTLRTYFTIQTVSFKKRQYADRAAERLRDLGHSVSINNALVNGIQYYRVRVGSFRSREKARTYANDMENRGEIEDYWISQVTRK